MPNKQKMKRRCGLTLNYHGSQKLNFSTMCEQVCWPNGKPVFLVNPHFIKWDANKDHTYCTIKKTSWCMTRGWCEDLTHFPMDIAK